ncbi:MAG: LysR family transcriptional regulator [Motiliproteus sp.]
MNISHKQLRAFVAVARTKSFAEACGLIHLSQPALSISIKNLEETLGGRLLARTTRTLALTPEGEAFYPVAQQLLADWEGALEDIHNRFALRRGKVSIAAMPSFACNLLPMAIKQFRQQHPAINIAVNDIIAEKVVETVQEGRMELGVTFDPGDLEDLLFTPLFEDRFVAVFSKDHPLLANKEIAWTELANYEFVLLQRPSSIRQLIEESMQAAELNISIAFEAHQLATIGRMVATGLGVSIVPSLCIQQMEELGAQCRPLAQPHIARKVGIISRRRYPLSVAAEALKKVLVEKFGQQHV